MAASCREAVALTQDLLALQAQWEAQLSALLGISFPAANKALGILVERGLLEAPAGKRNRLFVARGIVERLQRR